MARGAQRTVSVNLYDSAEAIGGTDCNSQPVPGIDTVCAMREGDQLVAVTQRHFRATTDPHGEVDCGKVGGFEIALAGVTSCMVNGDRATIALT
jgi:hypothetical protein